MTRRRAPEIPADVVGDVVGVEASFRAKQLTVRVAPRARVELEGEGEARTCRTGIPPSGTKDGETYRDVSATVTIRARVGRT